MARPIKRREIREVLAGSTEWDGTAEQGLVDLSDYDEGHPSR